MKLSCTLCLTCSLRRTFSERSRWDSTARDVFLFFYMQSAVRMASLEDIPAIIKSLLRWNSVAQELGQQLCHWWKPNGKNTHIWCWRIYDSPISATDRVLLLGQNDLPINWLSELDGKNHRKLLLSLFLFMPSFPVHFPEMLGFQWCSWDR